MSILAHAYNIVWEPLGGSKRYGLVIDRLVKDTIFDQSGCWLYQGHLDEAGYGRLKVGHKNVRIHRMICEHVKGKLLPEQIVLHSCDVRNCWNPDHLVPGTHADNVADMDAKGRRSLRHAEVLTEPEVRSIRVEEGSFRALGRKYGVCHHTIAKIKRGQSWQYLP